MKNSATGIVVWLTGLPASGKSTLAERARDLLAERNIVCVILDGDEMRAGPCSDLGFSPEDRAENVRRAAETARLLSSQGLVVVCALVSPYKRDRDAARSMMRGAPFIEAYVDCPVDICRSRDPKGHYEKASRGDIPSFTGVTGPYEPPNRPDLHLRTDRRGSMIARRRSSMPSSRRRPADGVA
ncbi:MAG: adenylyl-sulfate kinase [Deltaproteobacteria bacterium]|nr:adenylyl-sulfate kinase [Deltaproteobacteria bacterium]